MKNGQLVIISCAISKLITPHQMCLQKIIIPTKTEQMVAKRTPAAAKSLIRPIIGSRSGWNLSHIFSIAVLKASAENTKKIQNRMANHSCFFMLK